MAIQLKATLRCDNTECDAEAEVTLTAWPDGRISRVYMPPGWQSSTFITLCPACMEKRSANNPVLGED